MDCNGSLDELQTRGFVVIPGFLSKEEVDLCAADYHSASESTNKNYSLVEMSDLVLEKLRAKIEKLALSVSKATDIQTDWLEYGYYFATKKIKFGWHQDHESYFAYQDHYNYLNLWIPIVKPDRNKSNLSVIPFDRVRANSPDAWNELVGSGARLWTTREPNQTKIINDSGGRELVLNYDVNTLGTTPSLDAGDLLLCRGDVAHKSQDAQTDRVAASFRVVNSNTVISRARLARGGLKKFRMMARNGSEYYPMFRLYAYAGKQKMTVAERRNILAHLPANLRQKWSQPQSKYRFAAYLLYERVRAIFSG